MDLAKLSLWLTTAAKDKPLSFLDHHLRTGNAVVGARVSDLRPSLASPKATRKAKEQAAQTAAGQLSMLEDETFRQRMSTAVSSMWLIEEHPGDTLTDVKQQEEIYQGLRQGLADRYERLANLVTSTYFGVAIDPKLFKPLSEYTAGRGVAGLRQFDQWIESASGIAEQYRFFHWELEFPEVFFDRYGQTPGDRAGFDAVVGNPPYVRQELLSPLKPYLQVEYKSFDSAADLYVYFYERGVQLLRRGGRLAYISSGTFARANFAKPFRRFLPEAARLDTVIDFGENQPFPEAEMVRPSIVVLAREQQDGAFRGLFISDKVPASLDRAVEKDGVECDSSSLGLPEWTFQRADETHLLTKLLKVAQPLGQAARGRIYRGVITGLNEAFIIDGRLRLEMVNRDPSSSDMIKRVLRGQDLRPWYQEDEDRWLIVVPSGFTRSRLGAGADAESAWNRFRESYPAIAAHLAPYEEAARRRQDQGEFWWELRSCDYYAEFDKPKIFWPDIAKLPRFSWDETGALIGNTGHILTGASPALLGILQSRAIWFVISQICQPLRLRAGLWQYRLFPQFMERLPIPELSPDQENTLSNLAIRLTALARHRYALHRDARHRIQTDLGKPERELNRKLTDWWTLSFSTFRLEVREVLGSEIPVSERGQWEAWLDQQREEHRCLTSDIVTLETQLNARVFELFDLAKPEIELIETSTKYRYGEP